MEALLEKVSSHYNENNKTESALLAMEQNLPVYFSLGKVTFSIFTENVMYRNNELVDIPDSVLSPRNGMKKKWSEESGSQS